MVAKKSFMDRLIDLSMTKLFQLAEYVCGKATCVQPKVDSVFISEKTNMPVKPTSSTAQKEIVSTIHFSNQDRMVEGELFNNM